MSTAIALVLPVLLLVAWTIERREHLAAIERERDQWFRERQLLLNRIKPETAQYVPEAGPVQDPKAPRFDDDDAYWQSSLSTEELAERMLRDELAANAVGGE